MDPHGNDQHQDKPSNNASSSECSEQELEHLREFQNTIYDFLHCLCNYDIRTPLSKVIGFSTLLPELDSLTDEQKMAISAIRHAGIDILMTIDTVCDIVALERGIDFTEHKSEEVNLSSVILEVVSLAQQKVEYENQVRADLLQREKRDGRVIVEQAQEPVRIKLNIPDDLPTVQVSPLIVSKVLQIMVWFVVSHCLKTEVSFSASFDDHQISVSIGCSSFDRRDKYTLDAFHQFESVTAPFLLDPRIRTLYLCWHMLRSCDGTLHLEAQDHSGTSKPSTVTVRLTLPFIAI